MATIYEKTPGALVATPGRSVSTYPSGLCRVDKVLTCRTTAAASHRASLAVSSTLPNDSGAPAVDGLRIFPDVQEVTRGDGFTDFLVSAYGRTTRTARITSQSPVRSIRIGTGEVFVRFNVWTFAGSLVVQTGTIVNYEDLRLNDFYLKPFNFVISSAPNLISSTVTEIEKIAGVVATSPAGDTNSVYYTVGTRRKYRANYTESGATSETVTEFWITDPIVRVTARRDFGYWTEIDFETVRQPPEVELL